MATHEAINSDPWDIATAASSKLRSMLTMISGFGFEHFDSLRSDLKDDYLWTCSGLSDELHDALDAICAERTAGLHPIGERTST